MLPRYNPVFKNKDLTVETYIMHEFEEDFYGRELRVLVAGFMRPQVAFKSDDFMALLIGAIGRDVQLGREALAKAEALKAHALFGVGGGKL